MESDRLRRRRTHRSYTRTHLACGYRWSDGLRLRPAVAVFGSVCGRLVLCPVFAAAAGVAAVCGLCEIRPNCLVL